MDQSAFTFEQWSAAIADVAIRLEHQGFKVDQRPVGPSIAYRFVYRGTDYGTWQITPSATEAAFTFYHPTIETPASGVYDDPEADKAAWERKEFIEQAIIARARELFGDEGLRAKQKRVTGPTRDTRKKLHQLWEERDTDIASRGATQPFSNAWGSLGLAHDTVTHWIPKRVRDDWQTRAKFTWDEFTELWPVHLRNDYKD